MGGAMARERRAAPVSAAADEELAAAVRRGEDVAGGAVYAAYADSSLGFCTGLLRDRDDAADAAQDTFVRAVTHLDQLREPSRLRPWLFSIARREVFRRTRQRQRTVPVADTGE